MKFEQIPHPVPADLVRDTEKRFLREGLQASITPSELRAECEGDTNCETALAEMFKYAILYATDVWEMKLLVANKANYSSDEEWADNLKQADEARTRLHNTYMDSIAILSRALLAADRDNEWVRELAPTGTLERATCGKFAIMLTYLLAVNSKE